MYFFTIFGQNFHQGPKRAFSTQQFFTVFLSSIQCNPVTNALSYQLRNVALMLYNLSKKKRKVITDKANDREIILFMLRPDSRVEQKCSISNS